VTGDQKLGRKRRIQARRRLKLSRSTAKAAAANEARKRVAPYTAATPAPVT